MGSDRFSRHLDGFKVRTTGSVGNRRRHRIGQPALPEQQKRTIIRCHTESGKPPCLIQTVLFRLYGSRKSLKATDAMKAMYLHRDSTEVIGKILKCRYAIVQPHSGVQQKKTASFLLSPDMEKCIGKLKPASK